jgi:hypothetical protein
MVTYNGLSGKWNVDDDGNYKDGCPMLRSVDEKHLMDDIK